MMIFWHLKTERKKPWNKALKAPLNFRIHLITVLIIFFKFMYK